MIRATLGGAETIRDEQTGVTYAPASFDGGIGYVITHPDGRQECVILAPSRWHDVNERDSQGDTFVYAMTATDAAEWDADEAGEGWHAYADPVIYVNHFERENAR